MHGPVLGTTSWVQRCPEHRPDDSCKVPAKAQEPRGWAQDEASAEEQGFRPELGRQGDCNCTCFSWETAGKEPGLLSGLRQAGGPSLTPEPGLLKGPRGRADSLRPSAPGE